MGRANERRRIEAGSDLLDTECAAEVDANLKAEHTEGTASAWGREPATVPPAKGKTGQNHLFVGPGSAARAGNRFGAKGVDSVQTDC